MYLLVPAHPGCPGQSLDSCKMVVCVCVGKEPLSEGQVEQVFIGWMSMLSNQSTQADHVLV